MNRIQTYAERNVVADAPKVVTIPAATATFVLDDERRTPGEIVSRYIQNTGGNTLYYSIGVKTAAGAASCDNVANYHGYVVAGQQLDCSNHRNCVSVYSAAGTTVAVTEIRRNDMSHHN